MRNERIYGDKCEKPKGDPKEWICLCGKRIEHGYVHILKNRKNGNVIGIGDCCIHHFRDDTGARGG